VGPRFNVFAVAAATSPSSRSRAERDPAAAEVESLPLPGIQGRIVVHWDG